MHIEAPLWHILALQSEAEGEWAMVCLGGNAEGVVDLESLRTAPFLCS